MNCVQTPAQYSSSNSLATPEPHFIPGYLGYLPQGKYRPGHTFGMTSHRVLLDPCIHMSPRPVLSNIHPENCVDEFGRAGLGADPFMASKMALVQSRVNSFGRQQYQANMTPGYTGYVPRFQTILGHTYSPACNRALARFEQDQWRDRLFNKELEALDGWRFCYKTKPWESPEFVRNDGGDLQEFHRTPCANSTGSRKNFHQNTFTTSQPRSGCGCSGGSNGGESSYMGTVNIMSLSNNQRCAYGKERAWGLANQKANKKTCGLDVFINPNKHMKPINRLQTIYRECEGMIPHYNGHVPGEFFRFGKTYGTSTRNAKKSISKPLHNPLCMPLPR